MGADRLGAQDDSLLETRSRLEPIFDLFFYIPVGLAVTAAEELPKLAARGRAEIGGRVARARMIGRVAAGRGRREHIRRSVPARGGPSGVVTEAPRPGGVPERPEGTGSQLSGSPEAPQAPQAPRTAEAPGAADAPGAEVARATPEVTSPASLTPSSSRAAPPAAVPPPPSASLGAGAPASTGAGAPGAPEALAPEAPAPEAPAPETVAPEAARALPSPDTLAIPGYDSLAASQVVPRLAGLTSEELAAVGDYEAAHRRRTTILTRIRQLQGD
jgi:hypothetical protein